MNAVKCLSFPFQLEKLEPFIADIGTPLKKCVAILGNGPYIAGQQVRELVWSDRESRVTSQIVMLIDKWENFPMSRKTILGCRRLYLKNRRKIVFMKIGLKKKRPPLVAISKRLQQFVDAEGVYIVWNTDIVTCIS